MPEPSRISDGERARLRRYLLGTADERERMEVDRLIGEDAGWASAVVREQDALNRLDMMRQGEASAGFSPRVRGAARDGVRRKKLDGLTFLVVAASVLIALMIPAALLFRPGTLPKEHEARLYLHNMAVAFKTYSTDDPLGAFPPVSPYEGVWTFDLKAIYPGYIKEPAYLLAPSVANRKARIAELSAALTVSPRDWERATRIVAEGYTYTGVLMVSREDVEAVMGGGDGEGAAIRDGVERFTIADINQPALTASSQRDVPILFEGVMANAEGRMDHPIHVIYMDGAMKAYRMPDVPPVVRAVVGALALRP